RYFLKRQSCLNTGSPRSGLNFHMSAKLLHALPHSRDPNSKRVAGITGFVLCWNGHTVPVIADVDVQSGFCPADADNRIWTFRVPVNIGQTLLNEAESGNLNIPRKPAKLGGDIELGFNPTTLFESSGVPLQCRGQARFIQKRRMQQIR